MFLSLMYLFGRSVNYWLEGEAKVVVADLPVFPDNVTMNEKC